MDNFFDDYFSRINKCFTNTNTELLLKVIDKIKLANQNKKKIILAGNGGSAALASHVSVDLTKNAKIKSINFNESDLITCFANDFGYEKIFAKSLEFYADKGDILILISCSGNSQNLVEAANYAKKNGIFLITLTGFSTNNSLKKIGDLNLWADSKAYNIVEIVHQTWLLSIVDYIIGKIEYSA